MLFQIRDLAVCPAGGRKASMRLRVTNGDIFGETQDNPVLHRSTSKCAT